MARLDIEFCGIRSPNPFWLASAPPTDKAYNVERAFEAGWGGVVWKTLGEAGPPLVNVSGARYGALLAADRSLIGFNNIELITDRDLEANLEEIAAVKRRWPDRAMVVSIMGVDPETLTMTPAVGGKGSHGGYCGPAVKPIALNMVAEIARDPQTAGLPISGIGGIGSWRDALEFIALGAGSIQVCTAAMVFGFKIVQEMANGLATYLDAKGFASVAQLRGRALASVTDWSRLDLNRVSKAVIDQDKCIQCGRCHIVCEDTEHQAITATKDGRRHFEVKEEECVGCNLCVSICPVPECITLRDLAPGEVDRRTGRVVSATRLDWTAHPNNPLRTTG